MSDDPLRSMRERAALCRRLAKATTDSQASIALTDMAGEIDRDILRLEAQLRSDRDEAKTG
jgi:hypothetical protein